MDHTSDIQHLQKPNTTFLSLAAMSDKATGEGSLYVMYDSGSGPQVEEWTVPRFTGDPWVTSRNVTVDFGFYLNMQKEGYSEKFWVPSLFFIAIRCTFDIYNNCSITTFF